MKRSSRYTKKIKAVVKDCPFCKQGMEPDYKDTDILSRYMTDRGKLLGKSRTGLCSAHQRKVTEAVRRARHVALLPFVIRS